MLCNSLACYLFLSMRTQAFFTVIALFGMIQCSAQTPKPIKVAPGIPLPISGDGTVFVLDAPASGPMIRP